MPAFVTPAILAQWMAPFQPLFTRPTWQNLLVLVAGSILAPGRRTVTSTLSIMGLREMTTFTNFHRVLNRNRWSSRADLTADPVQVLGWFVRRWSVEVTLAEVRRHLGVETQRQWSHEAIARTTPALMGLFSLVTLWADETLAGAAPRQASWYRKPRLTFSDALASVRHTLWLSTVFETSRQDQDRIEIPRHVLNRLTQAVCFPA
jgi:hypothetical protein